MAGEDKRKGIPLQQPVFYWDYALGPRTGKNKKRGRYKINRCEVLISGNKCFYYGYILDGELYAYNAIDWKETFWQIWFDNNKNKKPAEFEKPKPGASFIHAPNFHKRVKSISALGERPKELKSIKLVPGEIYRFWVDYYMVDEEAIRSPQKNDRRKHFVGQYRWAAIPPHESEKAKKPKEWQVVRIPKASKGKRPKVVLNCRRYAFLPRIMDIVAKLRQYQSSYTKHIANLGVARSYLQCLFQIGSYSIQDDTQLSLHLGNWASGKKVDDWMRSYYMLTHDMSNLLEASEVYLLENDESYRLAQWASICARKLFHTLKDNKQFLLDFNTREANGHNSDQIRDIVAEASLILTRTPAIVKKRWLKDSEVTYNYDKSEVRGLKGFARGKAPNMAWAITTDGSPKVRGYWISSGWDKKYVDKIYKPFIDAAKSGGLIKAIDKGKKKGFVEESVETLSPLFAARENLTLLTVSLGAFLNKDAEKITKDVFQIMKDQKLISASVTFDQAKSKLKLNGSAADDFVEGKGMTGVLAGSGLTTMFKWLVMNDAWTKAGGTGKTKDLLDASQKTGDYFANGMGLADDFLSYIGKAEGAAKVLGKAGGGLSVLVDGFDTGLFVYYEFMVEDKQKRLEYSGDYLTKSTAYNVVITGGKALNTLGSAFTCSIVGAPIGLALKAIGLGISNLTELIKAIDAIGEKERKLFNDIWKKAKMHSATVEIMKFHDVTGKKKRQPMSSNVDTHLKVLDSKFFGLGDYWVGLKKNRIDIIRQVFNKYSQKDLQKKISAK